MSEITAYANPHYFSAILDGINHRFVLILECECIEGNEEYTPPRFSVGAVNATKDPRLSNLQDLVEVGVQSASLQIPQDWLMAHQYIYIVTDNTDQQGWQYRSIWSNGPLGPKDEPWSPQPYENSECRRRVWMTTIVSRPDLIRTKRLLSENMKVGTGLIKMQGDLMRYEKGTLTQSSWQRRKVTLYHNKLEFYAGTNKKGEVLLVDCEVKMLSSNQCPGKEFAFSIRNPLGSVGILLDAEDLNSRRNWVIAIQYQLSMLSHDFAFAPLEYGPPTGEYPDNRVLMCGDLTLHTDAVASAGATRHVQLTPRELQIYEATEVPLGHGGAAAVGVSAGRNGAAEAAGTSTGHTYKLTGRIFVEKAALSVSDDRSNALNFTVRSASGLTLSFAAPALDAKQMWIQAIRRQVQQIENQKLKLMTVPKEELMEDDTPVGERISAFYDEEWTAPAVDGEDEDYLLNVFLAPHRNNPDSTEFSETETAEAVEARRSAVGQRLTRGTMSDANISTLSDAGSPRASSGNFADMASAALNSKSAAVEQLNAIDSKSRPKSIPSAPLPKVTMDPKRCLINPKFILTVLKGITHRFILVLECESRKSTGVPFLPPARFSVGGAKACRDPRTTQLNQLLAISHRRPEIQLPSGWLMLHQYMYIIQPNTDEQGWQYRSAWSDGALDPKEEQWVEQDSVSKCVRRRLWMTTVVKRDDFIRAKRMVCENLVGVKGDIIMQGMLNQQPSGQSKSGAWPSRKVLLLHNRMEFYVGNDKRGELVLQDCVVQMMYGSECVFRENVFCVRHPSGVGSVLLEAENATQCRKWVQAINYQLAIISPDLNFASYPFGPPTGETKDARVLTCGELYAVPHAAGGSSKEWTKLHFKLLPRELLFLERAGELRGRLFVEGAVVKSRDDDLDFTFKSASGCVVHMRAENAETKQFWVRALRRQVQTIENDKHLVANTPIEEMEDMKSKSAYERKLGYFDRDWHAVEVSSEDDAFIDEKLTEHRSQAKEIFWGVAVPENSANSRPSSTREQSSSASSSDPALRYGGAFKKDPKDNDMFNYVSYEQMPQLTAQHSSLMAQQLTKDRFQALSALKTEKGFTLSNSIMPGVQNPSEPIGLSAGDEECFTVFEDLYAPVFRTLVKNNQKTSPVQYDYFRQYPLACSDASFLDVSPQQEGLLHSAGSKVFSVEFDCFRSVSNFSYPPGAIPAERSGVEQMLRKVFARLSGEFRGQYFRLSQLDEQQTIFVEPLNKQFNIVAQKDRRLATGSGNGGDRNWPSNRGLYVNDSSSLFMYVNDEEHLRLICTDNAGDIIHAFEQWGRVHANIKKAVESNGAQFSWGSAWGYLNSDLNHVGSGATAASVSVRLPQLHKKSHGDLPRVCGSFGLRCRHQESDVYRLTAGGIAGTPLSEVEVAQQLIDGLCCVLDVEDQMTQGATEGVIDDIVHEHRLKMEKLSAAIVEVTAAGNDSREGRHSSPLGPSTADSSKTAARAAAAALSHADSRQRQQSAQVEYSTTTTTTSSTVRAHREEHVSETKNIASVVANFGGGRRSTEDELSVPPASSRSLPSPTARQDSADGGSGKTPASPGGRGLTLQNSAKRGSFRGNYMDKISKNFETSGNVTSATTTTTSGKVMSYMDMNELVSTTTTSSTTGGGSQRAGTGMSQQHRFA